MNKHIAVVGTFDTKGEEFAYLVKCIQDLGCETITIDTGARGTKPFFPPDIMGDAVAQAAGMTLAEVAAADRGTAVTAMMNGVGEIVFDLYTKGKIDAVISMGGSAGTTIGTYAMRKLPIGVPKLMISTLAAGDVTNYVGAKDIMMLNLFVHK